MSVKSRETVRAQSRNRPSPSFMMLALWIAVTFFRPVARAWLERESRNPGRCFLGDDLQALDDARHDLVLQTRVEILGVLAHDDQVHAGEAARHARQVPHGSEVRVEIERLPQADVDAREPLGYRRRDRTLECDLVSANRVEQLDGQRLAEALERDDPCVVAFPLDVGAGGLENSDDRLRDFRADAVTGDQRDRLMDGSMVLGF